MPPKLENLWKLRDAAWTSFQRRANHEFKFALAVWGAAVVLIGLALKGDVHPVPPWLVVPALATFVVLHSWYERGMARSNDTDLAKCYNLETVILTEIGHTWSPELQERVNRHKIPRPTEASSQGRMRRWWGWTSKNWSHVGHVGVTAVLAFIAALLLCTKYALPSSKSETVAEGVLFSVEYQTESGSTGGFTRLNNSKAVPGGNGDWNVDARGCLTREFLVITRPQRQDLGPLVIPVYRLVSVRFGDGGIKQVNENQSTPGN